MRFPIARAALWGVAALVLACAATESRADDRCIEAFEHAQELRANRELIAARSELEVCAAASCPPLTTKDCTKWRAEVDADVPSIAIEPRRGDAKVTDARVIVDGKPFTDVGTAVEVDPGRHHVECQLEGASAKADIVVEPREKARVVTCTFDAPPQQRGLRVAGFVVGGIGIATLAVGAGFEIAGLVARQHLKDTCYPMCAPASVDSAHRSLVVGDVTVAIGLVAVATATTFLVVDLTSHAPKKAPAATTSLGFGLMNGGVGGSVRGEF
jgi:hypothetical protein